MKKGDMPLLIYQKLELRELVKYKHIIYDFIKNGYLELDTIEVNRFEQISNGRILTLIGKINWS